MRIVFCDDEPDILLQIQNYVKEYFQNIGGLQPEFAAYSSGDSLLKSEDLKADIAFLDVEMPGINGIHVGAKLKEANPDVRIFIVTAFPDYLDDAMRFQVFRYLSKPIDKNRLFRNLKDAVSQYNMESKTYAIETTEGIITLRTEEIVCVEAFQRQIILTSIDGSYRCTNNMDYWRKTLTLPCFFQPHRSFIINMRFVREIGKDIVLLRYGNNTKLTYLTRRKHTEFKDTYLMYLESVK